MDQKTADEIRYNVSENYQRWRKPVMKAVAAVSQIA